MQLADICGTYLQFERSPKLWRLGPQRPQLGPSDIPLLEGTQVLHFTGDI